MLTTRPQRAAQVTARLKMQEADAQRRLVATIVSNEAKCVANARKTYQGALSKYETVLKPVYIPPMGRELPPVKSVLDHTAKFYKITWVYPKSKDDDVACWVHQDDFEELYPHWRDMVKRWRASGLAISIEEYRNRDLTKGSTGSDDVGTLNCLLQAAIAASKLLDMKTTLSQDFQARFLKDHGHCEMSSIPSNLKSAFVDAMVAKGGFSIDLAVYRAAVFKIPKDAPPPYAEYTPVKAAVMAASKQAVDIIQQAIQVSGVYHVEVCGELGHIYVMVKQYAGSSILFFEDNMWHNLSKLELYCGTTIKTIRHVVKKEPTTATMRAMKDQLIELRKKCSKLKRSKSSRRKNAKVYKL